MGIAVLLGYLSSAFFIFSGLINMVSYLKSAPQMTDYAAFLNTLATNGWGLAVGTALYLLTQIALQCEKQAVMGSSPVMLTNEAGGREKSKQKAVQKASADLGD